MGEFGLGASIDPGRRPRGRVDAEGGPGRTCATAAAVSRRHREHWASMHPIKSPFLLLLLAMAICVPAAAAEPDPRVKRNLDRRDLAYEVEPNGDYKLTYELGDGRTQLAYVRSGELVYGAVRMREIVSISYRSPADAFPAEVANRILEENNKAKIGAWSKQGRLAVFSAQVPVDADAKTLADAIEASVRLADRLERELAPDKDEF